MALNEALFRTANERMAAWEEVQRAEGAELFFCECADPECREKIRLLTSDYERIRRDPCHFFVKPGHDVPDIEDVIEPHDEWVVIEKNPEVSEIVEATDPRSP